MESSAWRAVAAFRWLTLVYAVTLNLDDLGRVAGPEWTIATLAVMAGWSVFGTVAYARPAWRKWPLLVADMAVTCATILATLRVETPERIAVGELTVPTVWAATVVLAWALRWEVVGGLLGTVCVAAANIVVDGGTPTRATVHSLVLVLLAGVVVGYVMEIIRRTERVVAEVLRVQGAAAERERLSRRIHDGVLQVLSLVRRRGLELGGDSAELGRLAGEQEVALRSLVGSDPPHLRGDGLVDLLGDLGAVRSARVQVSGPAGPVLVPGAVADELTAAVGAALHNVREHVGPDAEAWVLVEETDVEILVTVRDDGPGIPPGRLAVAAADGRLGVAQSIRGRLRDLGGSARLTSAPGEGTEVELRVPRR